MIQTIVRNLITFIVMALYGLILTGAFRFFVGFNQLQGWLVFGIWMCFESSLYFKRKQWSNPRG